MRFQKYEQISFTNTPNVEVKSVAINGNTIVMVGGTTRYHWRSTDGGDNWTEYSTNLPSSQDWRIVRYDNSQYVAVAYGSTALAYSSDGITWNSVTLAASGNWTHLEWNGAIWLLAAQNSSTMFTSTNGSTWTQRTGAVFDESGIGVDRVNNEFMIDSGANDLRISHSTDGISWTTKADLDYFLRPYDISTHITNILYIPTADKWVCFIEDNYNGPPNQAHESFDKGATWNIMICNGKWSEANHWFVDGAVWDGDCYIWFVTGNYFRGYYMMDGNSFHNFNGPGYGSTPGIPTGFDAEYERFMIVPSYELSETTFDYVWKYFYGDYDPQTYFCVPNLQTRHEPGIKSYIKLQ